MQFEKDKERRKLTEGSSSSLVENMAKYEKKSKCIKTVYITQHRKSKPEKHEHKSIKKKLIVTKKKQLINLNQMFKKLKTNAIQITIKCVTIYKMFGYIFNYPRSACDNSWRDVVHMLGLKHNMWWG